MDNVLLIDALNSIYRANVSFGPSKTNCSYCRDCEKFLSLHQLGHPHCVCGGDWDMIDDKCCNSSNEDNSLIYNFFKNLRPIIEKFSPDKCFFVLEGHPQFRYDLFSQYKANRIIKTASKQNTRDKIFRCQEKIVNLLKYLPITICKADAYEGDDTIATLCENMKEENLTVVSNDSDYIQLLQRGYKHCNIYNPIKKEFMVAPNWVYIAWKSLSGDKSDNIPTLLTPKKVEKALTDPEVFKKFMSIEENRANFNINRQLIEFRYVPEDELIIYEGIANFNELKKEFAKMEFESIINDDSWKKYVDTFKCLKY